MGVSAEKQCLILGKPALNTTQLGKRLGIGVSAKLLTDLGLPPDETTPISNMWYESRFPYICYELSQHFYGLSRPSEH